MIGKCKNAGCFNDGICGDDRCPQHTRSKKHLLPNTGGRKKPRTALPHLGIELECFASSQTIHDVMCSQKVQPVRDGSLPNFGAEFKLCHPLKVLEKHVVDLATKLQAAGAVVNNRCGLHVHLDAREISSTRIACFLVWLKSFEDWLFKLMPPSRRNNQYCQRIGDGYNSHYTWANKSMHGTVEIRMHGGTLNPHKLVGWLHVCESLRRVLWSDEPLPVFESTATFDPVTGAMLRTTPTNEWMEKVFDAKAIEYLRARENSNGVLGTTNGTPNGMAVETETN